MKRDFRKQAEEGRKIKNNRRDIRTSEFEILYKMGKKSPQGLFDAISIAFNFGFYQGYAQRKTEEKK